MTKLVGLDPYLSSTFYAAVGVLALVSKEDSEARLSFDEGVPVIHSSVDISSLDSSVVEDFRSKVDGLTNNKSKLDKNTYLSSYPEDKSLLNSLFYVATLFDEKENRAPSATFSPNNGNIFDRESPIPYNPSELLPCLFDNSVGLCVLRHARYGVDMPDADVRSFSSFRKRACVVMWGLYGMSNLGPVNNGVGFGVKDKILSLPFVDSPHSLWELKHLLLLSRGDMKWERSKAIGDKMINWNPI